MITFSLLSHYYPCTRYFLNVPHCYVTKHPKLSGVTLNFHSTVLMIAWVRNVDSGNDLSMFRSLENSTERIRTARSDSNSWGLKQWAKWLDSNGTGQSDSSQTSYMVAQNSSKQGGGVTCSFITEAREVIGTISKVFPWWKSHKSDQKHMQGVYTLP
jgi:hypothetical protein